MLPTLVQILVIIYISIILVRKLLAFRRWNDELRYVGTFVKAVATLIAVVVLENFCTWWVFIYRV